MKSARVAKKWLVGVTYPRFITQLDEVIPMGETPYMVEEVCGEQVIPTDKEPHTSP
jgi:hypothetical protein